MTACISYVFYVRQCRIHFYRGVHAPQGRIKGDTIVSPFPGLADASPFLCGTACFNLDTACNDKPPRPLGGPGGLLYTLVVYTCCIYIYLMGNMQKALTLPTMGLSVGSGNTVGKVGKGIDNLYKI